MPTKELVIAITPDGDAQYVWDDSLVGVVPEAVANIDRASHVEPIGSEWYADLSPIGGPTIGPYVRRGDALAAEVKWITERLGAIGCRK